MTSINKVKFASIKNKRHYQSDSIVSLPFGHHLLNEITEYKKSLTKIHTVIEKKLRVLRSIYSQPITYYKLNESNTFKIKSVEQTTTCDYILNSKFLNG